MKKFLAIIAVVAVFGATACKKDYTCTCVGLDGNGNQVSGSSASTTIENSTKADAEADCNEGDFFISGTGGADCEIE